MQVHRELCLKQAWIEEMVHDDGILELRDCSERNAAVIQHYVLISWLSNGLCKLYQEQYTSEIMSKKVMKKFVEALVSISNCHPSSLIFGLFYLKKHLKVDTQIAINPDSFKGQYIICVVLACKMFEDVEKLDIKKFFTSNLSNYVISEKVILKNLDYQLHCSYDEFLQLIRDFSEDIHVYVVNDVSKGWNKLLKKYQCK
eukprot:gene1433-12052_t